MSDPRKSINWLDNTSRALGAHHPSVGASAGYVTEQLCSLLLERLPPNICQTLMGLLPDEQENLQRCAKSSADHSIGFADFVHKAENALGTQDVSLSEDECTRIAETFLWSVSYELPLETKSLLAENLPAELRLRMNLLSGYAEDAKVA